MGQRRHTLRSINDPVYPLGDVNFSGQVANFDVFTCTATVARVIKIHEKILGL